MDSPERTPEPRPAPSPWQWCWPLSLATAISWASGTSGLAGPDLPFSYDKIVHFAVFGLLATLVTRMRPGIVHAALSVIAVSLFGAADEWHQSFTPGRMVEVYDWIADTLGAIAAVAVYVLWPAYRRWLEAPLRRPKRTAPIAGNGGAEAPAS